MLLALAVGPFASAGDMTELQDNISEQETVKSGTETVQPETETEQTQIEQAGGYYYVYRNTAFEYSMTTGLGGLVPPIAYGEDEDLQASMMRFLPYANVAFDVYDGMETPEEYCEKYYRQNGFFEDSGLALLLNYSTKKYGFYSGGAISQYLPEELLKENVNNESTLNAFWNYTNMYRSVDLAWQTLEERLLRNPEADLQGYLATHPAMTQEQRYSFEARILKREHLSPGLKTEHDTPAAADGNEAETAQSGAAGGQEKVPIHMKRTTSAGYKIEIRDEEGLLSEEQAEKLLDEMESVGAYTNAAFATYSSSSSTQNWTDRNYYSAGFFNPGGVVFVINMMQRKLNVRFAGDTSQKLGYSTATSIEDNVYRYASKGDYYTCASKVFSQISGLYRGRWIAQPMKVVISLLLGLCAGMMILFLYLRRSRRKERVVGTMLSGSIGAAVLASEVTTHVYKRKRIDSDGGSGGGGGFGGGGGGGGGGGFSGGGGSSGGSVHGF